ncbi:MAG TPA: hypothetical protein VN673_13940, partial [Clostridia bacterium]|nr:hypothetical protein [Clostridia bacterium]
MRAFGRLHRLVQVTGASFLGLLCSNVGAAEDQQLEVTNSTSVATTNAAVDEKTQLPVRGVQTVEPGNTVTNDMFEVKPGFRLELVASEPLVESPVAMAFDQDGRLFVLERDDPDADNPGGTGRVRVLEDPDGEGVFSGSTILADGLVSPSAIVCYEGGVFVAAGPEILFLKDTQGRGTGDVHRVAFRG